MSSLDGDLSGYQEGFELDEDYKPEVKKHPMYDLKLNEEYIVRNTSYEANIWLIIRRVPSGWIYEYFEVNTMRLSLAVFVPYVDSYKYSDEL